MRKKRVKALRAAAAATHEHYARQERPLRLDGTETPLTAGDLEVIEINTASLTEVLKRNWHKRRQVGVVYPKAPTPTKRALKGHRQRHVTPEEKRARKEIAAAARAQRREARNASLIPDYHP